MWEFVVNFIHAVVIAALGFVGVDTAQDDDGAASQPGAVQMIALKTLPAAPMEYSVERREVRFNAAEAECDTDATRRYSAEGAPPLLLIPTKLES